MSLKYIYIHGRIMYIFESLCKLVYLWLTTYKPQLPSYKSCIKNVFAQINSKQLHVVILNTFLVYVHCSHGVINL